jgi:hypothetical protein
MSTPRNCGWRTSGSIDTTSLDSHRSSVTGSPLSEEPALRELTQRVEALPRVTAVTYSPEAILRARRMGRVSVERELDRQRSSDAFTS